MSRQTMVNLAQEGDKEALEQLVTSVQDNVYYLALRMLADPEDARDAAQEILIKVVTRLSTFKGASAFSTWVYRVATNHLLTARKIKAREAELTFSDFKEDLESDLEDSTDLAASADYGLMLNEVRLGCTMAMLLCLNPKHRIAYIIGDIFELDHKEASSVLGIAPATYRQQLSRARSKVQEFTKQSCGLVSDSAACHCDLRLHGAIRRGRVDLAAIKLAHHGQEPYDVVHQRLAETRASLKSIQLQQAVPRFKSPIAFGLEIQELVERALR